jgi:hypothetical protein
MTHPCKSPYACGHIAMILREISYKQLNARQKENFNFQKVSAVLADYGFATLRLSDDWHGADFIAVHIGGQVLRVQLKSRLGFYKKYRGKDLYVAFGVGEAWYLYPHDELLAKILKATTISSTVSWCQHGGYTFPRLPKSLLTLLEPYRLRGSAKPLPR